MKIVRVLKRIKNNIIFLCRYDLSNKAEADNDLIYRTIRHTEDLTQTDMVFSDDDSIRVLNDDLTWKKILSEPGSIVRIGDGELKLIAGGSIDFQKYDKRLADYLVRILNDNRTDLYIGIDYNYFHGFDNVTEYIRQHNYLWGPIYKKILIRYCNPDREYISSSFNQEYIDYVQIDRDQYLDNIHKLFEARDVVVFAGEGIFNTLTYSVFECAASCEYVWAPSHDAFDEFDALLEKARTYPKSKTLCFILGPASKPLVYELSKDGYTVWDIGHLAKDYDYCLRNASKEKNDIISFFAPD